MEFVKKHFFKIVCGAILLCVFLPFVTVPDDFGGKDKFSFAFFVSNFLKMKGGAFIFFVPACAVAALVCDSLNKNKASAILTVGGFVSLLIAPKAVFNLMYFYGEAAAKEDGAKRSVGFVFMLLLYILLLLITAVRFLNSSASDDQEADNSSAENADEAEADDSSKVDLNK